MVFYTKGALFGTIIGIGIGSLFTNIYIRKNYILLSTNIKDIIDNMPKK